MPDVNTYDAVVWVIKDDKAVETYGMRTYSLDRANEFAVKISQTRNDDGYVTISDLSNGKELIRLDFEFDKAAFAAAA